MPKVAIYDLTGKKTGEEIELMDYVFGVEFNEAACPPGCCYAASQ